MSNSLLTNDINRLERANFGDLELLASSNFVFPGGFEMRNFVRPLLLIALLSILSFPAFAITWLPEDFNCPLDGQKNTFLVVGSYGSYIYSYPSKYQWLFFPRTDSPTYYTCKKCYLTTYMWDFDKLPKDKFDEIRRALNGVSVSKNFKEYTELPVTERLEIMEKVYSVLGKDDDWWETFYRTKGYHYGKEGKPTAAAEARKRSLQMIEAELERKHSDSPRKLSLYISASMKHFLGRDNDAIADLETALKTPYSEKGATEEDIKNAEAGLNERITDYIERIRSKDQKPRLFDASGTRGDH